MVLMEDEFNLVKDKPKEDTKKKINFQEMPKNTDEILGKKKQEEIVEKYTKSEPVAMPYDNPGQSSHLSLILSPNLRDLELMIRGLQYVKRYNPVMQKEEVILEKIADHPLNEYGINKILELIRIWSSSELKLGRRNHKDAIESAQQIGIDAKRLIYKNLKKFGMDTQTKQRNAKTYALLIFEFAYSALSRSVEGRENDASRPTEFNVQGSVDNLGETPRFLSPQKKEQLKN
jgi:hypothetical protein